MRNHGYFVAGDSVIALANDGVYQGSNVILSNFFKRKVPIVIDLKWVQSIQSLVLEGVETATSAGNPDIVALLGQLYG